MTREEIFTKLKEIMSYTVKNPETTLQNIGEQSDLYTDLGMTSVGLLYSVIAMEEVFGISFADVEFQDFKTVGDVITFIQKSV